MEKPQLLAANVDACLCVVSPSSPPWRPRFADRLLLQADIAGIPAALIVNKWDLAGEACTLDLNERLADFHRLGYTVFRVSAKTGEGLDVLRAWLAGKRVVLTGQSGAGKSSLINALLPGLGLRVGALNEKYDRGNHTTTQGELVEGESGGVNLGFIDTPGVRRLLPDGVTAQDLILYFREAAPYAGQCRYGAGCTHTVEPGCKILEAVAAGVMLEDRYESYLRLREELEAL
jgi:ribosome biogenesis GTPase